MTKSARFTDEQKLTIATRDGFRCARHGGDGGTDVHHRLPRGMGGTRDPRSRDLRNGVLLCRTCHEHVETHRAEALEQGWLLRSYDDLDQPLVTVRGDLVTLTADGRRVVTLGGANRPPARPTDHAPELAWDTLRAVLEGIELGALWTSDVWHDEAAMAQLTSSEKAAAQDRAVREGWARRVLVDVDGRTAAVQVPSLIPSRKRGAVQLLRRTDASQPAPALILHHTEQL